MTRNKRARIRTQWDSEDVFKSSDDLTYFEEHDIIIRPNKKTKRVKKMTKLAHDPTLHQTINETFAYEQDEPSVPESTPSISTHKTSSQLLHDLDLCVPTFMEALIALETPLLHTAIPVCMQCSNHPGSFQCLECHLSPLLCQECLVNSHCSLPLHTISQFVTDSTTGLLYRRKATLFDLGLLMHLGHCGLPCPSQGTASDVKTFVIVHTNGVHKMRIRYCTCSSSKPHLYQLMVSRLFPATTERPQTLFTHKLLEEFCQHTHEAGTTSYAYFAAIRRLTDDIIWDNVQDRYREFLRAGRIWRHLKDLLRSGDFIGIGEFLPTFYQNSHAIACPACPQPGINLSPNYLDDIGQKPHKYKFFAAIDGNFRQVLKSKPHDTGDYSLSDGKAFFVEETKYQEYLKSTQDSPELSTCTGFKAGDILRQNRIKGLAVTGIVAVSCSRHNMIRPQGLVDLYYGERYSNVDYAVSSTLRQYNGTGIPIELAYDIACKYGTNFDRRMEANFPDIHELIDQITFLVPSMHIKAHERRCQKKFTRDFSTFTGKCDAEGCERIWSELNQWAASTSEMNPGHRHDIINDNINDWNWRKVAGIGAYLVDRWLLAAKQRRICKQQFDDFTAATSEDLIKNWKTLSITPVESPDGKRITSVFFLDEKKVPTQAEIRLAIIEEEQRQQGSMEVVTQSKIALHDALVFALDLEQSQINTRRMVEVHSSAPTDSNTLTLHSMRKSLQTKLNLWKQYQELHLLSNAMTDSYTPNGMETPELVGLGLPSSMTATEQLSLQLEMATALERRLRETYAFASINNLKHQLALQAASQDARRRHVVGQKDSTRARRMMELINDTIKLQMNTYQRHRAAMCSLGLSEDDATFQELKMEDCTLSGLIREGDSSKDASKSQKNARKVKNVSWIWRIGYQLETGKEMSDWDVEFQRTQWFVLRAAKDRWHEEVEIVEEEMRRVTRFFKFWEDAWTRLVMENTSKSKINGTSSYAIKMANVYQTLYANVLQKFPKEILDETSTISTIDLEIEEEVELSVTPLGIDI